MGTKADPAIGFDEQGVCHHCLRYDALVAARVLKGEAGVRALRVLAARVRVAGNGREFDCLIGVSGGVDSTYTAFLVKQQGLRPLAVHFDNGWDSELAVKNIEHVLRGLDVPLYTFVVDWEEFRDLQVAFLRASTPDGEIPTDHAINALLWREANRRGIRYVISGMNFTTESISVPGWSYGHSDWRYIKDVQRRFGTVKLRTYPRFTLAYLFYVNLIRGIRTLSILNYVDYDKARAMELLRDELGWREYGGKHHESVYTRFYQGYLLPRKFGIDKRYGHLSDLVNAGQMRRGQALEEARKPPYPEEEQRRDKEYVIKKLGLSSAEFEEIMRAPARSFRDFRNSYAAVALLKRLVTRLRALGLYPR